MFKFDPTKLTVEYHLLKSVSTALGGSITVVDQENSTPEKEEYLRWEIPFAVARKFVKETQFTKYLKPVTVCILRYDGQVINLERDIASNIKAEVNAAKEANGEDPLPKWKARIEIFVNDWLHQKLGDNEWYFDGRYIFYIDPWTYDQLQGGGDVVTYVSENNTFRFVEVPCIDLYYSNKQIFPSVGIDHEMRDVLAFSSGSCFAVTPPIWKNFTAIGSSSAMDESERDAEDFIDTTVGISAGETRIPTLVDQLDQNYALNLNFTMSCAKKISTMFGFDAVEPLQLPEIMIQLLTVNIPSLPKHIKSTFGIGLIPSHGLVWLMGMLDRTTTLQDYIEVRACIKYLTTKGLFRKASVHTRNVFVDEEHQTLPPALDVKAYMSTLA